MLGSYKFDLQAIMEHHGHFNVELMLLLSSVLETYFIATMTEWLNTIPVIHAMLQLHKYDFIN